MADLVKIIGVTHNPYLPGMMAEADPEPAIRQAIKDYDLMRRKLADARPDALIVIASDHLNQWFMDNMPPFIVGKARRTEGPFPHEIRNFGHKRYAADIDVDLAKWIIAEGSRQGVDFAFSDEFLIDHAFTVALNFLRPEMDLPIVPIFTNVMAPPLPESRRFYEVGRVIRSVVEAMPGAKRVGVVSSGHTAVEVGGIKSSTYSADPGFDRQMMDLIARGEAERLVREATIERMRQAGNVATGFANFIMLMGLADGRTPESAGVLLPEKTAGVPHMAWGSEAA
jgi:protocatechuate 4,5-dioxygenase beta chain